MKNMTSRRNFIMSMAMAAAVSTAMAVPGLAADGWNLDTAKPGGQQVQQPQAGQQPPQGQQAPDPAMRARFRARGDTQRFVLGALKLEKDKKLAITKAQAIKLKPLVAAIQKKDMLGLKNPTQGFSRMGQAQGQQGSQAGTAQQGFGGPDQDLMKELADTLTKIEKIMNSKQLGAVDAMEFTELPSGRGGFGNRQGSGQGNGQSGAGQGRRSSGGGQGFGGQGGGFARMDPKELEKLRKEMEDRQKKQAAVLTKAMKDLTALLDKRAK